MRARRIRDPESEMFLTLEPGSGMEKFGSGIRDKHSGSATLNCYVKMNTFSPLLFNFPVLYVTTVFVLYTVKKSEI